MKNTKAILLALSLSPLVLTLHAQDTKSAVPSAGPESFLDSSDEALGAMAGAAAAKRDAEAYVQNKKWSLGMSEDGKFVAIGFADIAGRPENPNFQKAREIAFVKALLNAKEQVAMTYGQKIATETMLNAQQAAKNPENFAPKPNDPPPPGITAKIKMLINAKLDQALRNNGVEPAKATKEQVKEAEKAVLTTEFRRTITRMAAAEVGALITQKVFESGESIAVVAYYNPKAKGLMDAILGKGPAPTGKPQEETINQWISKFTVPELYASHGVQIRVDENGQLNLVAFGQSVAEISSTLGGKMAETAAETNAIGALRDYAGEYVEADIKQEIFERTKQFGDMDKASAEVEQDSQMSQKISARAAALTVAGIGKIRTWTTSDKRSKRIIVGAVVVWNIRGSETATEHKQAFAESAGSKGGDGAPGSNANTAEPQRPKAGSSKNTYDPTKGTKNNAESPEADPF